MDKLSPGQSYFRRGSGEASHELKGVIEQHRQWVSGLVRLDDFPYGYITSGATEAINQWRMTDSRPWQFLEGDYSWPQIVSGNGVETSIDRIVGDRVLYVSNPSCRDGNFLSADEINKINLIGCPVILDCAYIGSTALRKVAVFDKTEQIFFSFSKGWGLIGQRVGLVYAKHPHATLRHMARVECWNYQTTQIAREIMNQYGPESMYEHSKSRQFQICEDLHLTPSDTYFLANSQSQKYEKQMRVPGKARLSLTPLWETHGENLASED